MISVSRVAFFPTGSSEAPALILSAWTVIVVSWLVSLPPGVHLPPIAMYILHCHYSDPSDMKIQWKSFKGKLFNLAYMVTLMICPLPPSLVSCSPSCSSPLNQTVVILYAFVCVLCLKCCSQIIHLGNTYSFCKTHPRFYFYYSFPIPTALP